jgi:hypothetical protein
VPAGAASAAAVRDVLGKLTDHDIRVVVTAEDSGAVRPESGAGTGAGDAGLDWARPLARLADAPWLTPWTEDDAARPATYLLDLACARECAQADAVGFGAGEYEFTHWLETPALVRSALLAPGGPSAADWGSHGLRLFTITA